MLDASEVKFLNAEQQERLRAFEEMFGSKGWKFFIDIAKNQFEQAKAGLIQAQTWPENRIAAGRLSVLAEIARFEEQVENEFQQIATQNEAEQAVVDLDDELDYE
mgnify:CR=1 FL=1